MVDRSSDCCAKCGKRIEAGERFRIISGERFTFVEHVDCFERLPEQGKKSETSS